MLTAMQYIIYKERKLKILILSIDLYFKHKVVSVKILLIVLKNHRVDF